MQRGDLVIVATGGGYGGKPRPALVIQSDLLAAKPTVILLGFTTEAERAPRWRPIFDPTPSNGLQQRSALMTDTPFLAPREKVDRVIGHLAPADIRQVENALMLVLGLG